MLEARVVDAVFDAVLDAAVVLCAVLLFVPPLFVVALLAPPNQDNPNLIPIGDGFGFVVYLKFQQQIKKRYVKGNYAGLRPPYDVPFSIF